MNVLFDVINDYTLVRIFGESVALGYSGKQLEATYSAAFQQFYINLQRYMGQEYPDGWITCVLEKDTAGAGAILKYFQQQTEHPGRILSLGFEDKRCHVILQTLEYSDNDPS